MELRRLDICLRANDLGASLRFYSALGFQLVEGSAEAEWIVLELGSTRIGLFGSRFMGGDRLSLNFRDGDVMQVASAVVQAGYAVPEPRVSSGGRSIEVRDPDGNLLFFDSAKA